MQVFSQKLGKTEITVRELIERSDEYGNGIQNPGYDTGNSDSYIR